MPSTPWGHQHLAPPFDAMGWMQSYAQTWSASLDPSGVGRWLRGQRLGGLIRVAVTASPFYARRAPHATRLGEFAPVTKSELMREFDDWATDRQITRTGVDAFVSDAANVADGWLGRYVVWTSSGTSGCPGVFVQDSASLAAYDAIDALRLRGASPTQSALGLWGLGRSFAFVGATGGHFAGHVSFERLRRLLPRLLAPVTQVISVLQPLSGVAQQLLRMRPDVLITYPSCAVALARMRLRGDLPLAPLEIWLGGEQLSSNQRDLLRRAFGCTVRNAYGASEFYSIAFECAHGQLHVNDDWVILEAVDAQLRPVAAGELSHTTLLTNLANRVQPLLRYRLDDRIRWVPGRCACGCAFPVIQVEGRADDTLVLTGRSGAEVTILPLALETAIEERARLTQFQLLRLSDGRLELRLEPGVSGVDDAVRRCRRTVAAFLAEHGVARTGLTYSALEPLRHASGKVMRVMNAPVAPVTAPVDACQ